MYYLDTKDLEVLGFFQSNFKKSDRFEVNEEVLFNFNETEGVHRLSMNQFINSILTLSLYGLISHFPGLQDKVAEKDFRFPQL